MLEDVFDEFFGYLRRYEFPLEGRRCAMGFLQGDLSVESGFL